MTSADGLVGTERPVYRSRRVAWVVLGLVVIGVLAAALWPGGGDESESARVRRLASELRCVDCEGLSVAESATASARIERRDIAERVHRGDSDETILGFYVGKYRESVLLKPSSRGVGILVWVLPVLGLLLGAAALGFALRRWARQPRLTPTAADTEFVAEHRAAASKENKNAAEIARDSGRSDSEVWPVRPGPQGQEDR